jgi:small subunit ribosomal protein S2
MLRKFFRTLSVLFNVLLSNANRTIRSAALLTKVIAAAVAEGLQARAGVGGNGDKPEAEGAEPLAEWEQELLASATATASPTAEGAEPGTPEADIQTEPKTPEGS